MTGMRVRSDSFSLPFQTAPFLSKAVWYSQIMTYVLFFAVGVVQDLLITYYYQMITKEYAWRSAVISTLVTIVNVVILYEILDHLAEQAITVILAYALGNGVGTFIVVKRHQIKGLFLRSR